MSDLRNEALKAQLDVLRVYIRAQSLRGETVIELFEWYSDGLGYHPRFAFTVKEAHMVALQEELGFKEYHEATSTDEEGWLWWKKTVGTYKWYSVVL